MTKNERYSINVTDALRDLRISQTYLYRLLREGKLKGIKQNKMWWLDKDSVESLKAALRMRGLR